MGGSRKWDVEGRWRLKRVGVALGLRCTTYAMMPVTPPVPLEQFSLRDTCIVLCQRFVSPQTRPTSPSHCVPLLPLGILDHPNKPNAHPMRLIVMHSLQMGVILASPLKATKGWGVGEALSLALSCSSASRTLIFDPYVPPICKWASF